jgi:hypothetical protein
MGTHFLSENQDLEHAHQHLFTLDFCLLIALENAFQLLPNRNVAYSDEYKVNTEAGKETNIL